MCDVWCSILFILMRRLGRSSNIPKYFDALITLNFGPLKIIRSHKIITSIFAECIYWTRKQSGVCRILKVYKEGAHMSAVNTRSQNSVRNILVLRVGFVKSTKSQKNQGFICVTFEQRPRKDENSWKCHIFRGQIPMWVSFNIFEITFFWKFFMCTFIRKVIQLVF